MGTKGAHLNLSESSQTNFGGLTSKSSPTTKGLHCFHRQFQGPQPGPRSVYLLPDIQVDMIFPESSACVGDRPTAKRGSNWLLRGRQLIPFLWPGPQLISQLLLSSKLYASFLFIWRFDLTLWHACVIQPLHQYLCPPPETEKELRASLFSL